MSLLNICGDEQVFIPVNDEDCECKLYQNFGYNNDGPISQRTVTQKFDSIDELIPPQASSENQLADKEFVNSTVSTNTATFRGTYNSVAELEAYSGEKDNNDYAFVIIYDETEPTEVSAYHRYKYDGFDWVFEYSLNNSSFTAEQWAAINSGLVAAPMDNKLYAMRNGLWEELIGIGAVWGAITGDITDQADLNNALTALSNRITALSNRITPLETDYIVETGTSNGYTYWKWNSGRLEAERIYNLGQVTCSITVGTQLRMSNFFSIPAPTVATLETMFNISASLVACDSDIDIAGAWLICPYETSGRLVAQTNQTVVLRYTKIALRLINGRWK